MHISRLDVRNFRNFAKASFLFKEGVNTLIGENGSGKTNAFYAIRLLLDDTLSRRANMLRESDFNRSISWKGHWIIISLHFDKLDASEGCQLIRHGVGHMNADCQGTYTFFFRPKKEIRSKLHMASFLGTEEVEFRSLLESITLDQYEFLFTGRATSDFTDDETYKQIVGDFDELSFPDPDKDDVNLLGVPTASLHKEVTCTFVKALRDVVADLRSYRDSPLLNLLRGSEQGIELAEFLPIIQAVTQLNDDISNLSEIQKLSKGIQKTLLETVGHTYSPKIDIKSALPEEEQRLLQNLSLRVGDPNDSGYQGDLVELSLGGANLIYLSLKLLEYESKLSTDRVSHFLLIEEPEAHIHTHIQKTLFEKYKYEQTQVIVSTHSTHISAASRIRSVNILSSLPQRAEVFHPSVGLSDDQCHRIERYLDAIRSTLLFAKGVVLVEGDAELILIPALFKAVFGISIDELGVSLINMNSAVFENIALVFDDDRVRRRCAIISDQDASIVELPKDRNSDDDFERSCRNSQESGSNRKVKLDEFCNGNSWVESFLAEYTFEVELLQCGNRSSVVDALPSIYPAQAARRKSSKEKLQDDEISISGKEVLRLAKKVGKGWFAVLLAENLDVENLIPSYVLQAIAFACQESIDARTLRLIGLHRIEEASDTDLDVGGLYNELEELTKLSTAEFIASYKERLPEDELSEFMSYLGAPGDHE